MKIFDRNIEFTLEDFLLGQIQEYNCIIRETAEKGGPKNLVKHYAKIKEYYEQLLNEHRAYEIVKRNVELDNNYEEQCSGSTKTIKMCIPNCVSKEEDENYTDDCYPNSDFRELEDLMNL